jgi:hypothetical protein
MERIGPAELSDAARALNREFVTKFSLPSHGAFPITVEDIVGPVLVPIRRQIPPLFGRGRGR